MALTPPVNTTRYTGLQKHVAFFDKDQNGTINFSETRAQLSVPALGQSSFKAAAQAALIHGAMGDRKLSVDVKTRTVLGFDVPVGLKVKLPTFNIDVATIQTKKHGSDTDVFDANGNVDHERFNQVFNRFDTAGTGRITAEQVFEMVHGNKDDTFGHIASKGEFRLLMDVAGSDEMRGGKNVRVISKLTLLKMYEGTLFFEIAGQKAPWLK